MKKILLMVVALCATVLTAADAPRVLAHRGGLCEYDDNALGGFKKCYEAGVRGFEVDFRFSADEEIVLMHDATVKRTVRGCTNEVERMTLAELTACKLKKSGENVPSGQAFMEIFKGKKDVFIELEMKAYPTIRVAGGKYIPHWFYTKERLERYCDKLYNLAKNNLEPGTYAFTCFNQETIATMRRLHPDAPCGLIKSSVLKRDQIEDALRLGCVQVASYLVNCRTGEETSPELVKEAHARGLRVTLWPTPTLKHYLDAQAKGADCVTSDFPMQVHREAHGESEKGYPFDLATTAPAFVKKNAKKRLVCLDLDATLSQHRTKPPQENLDALRELEKKYKCIMVGAGNAPRIYKQMGNYPIDILANYGMQESRMVNGEFKIVRQDSVKVDREFFLRETDKLRKKYGYTEYAGKPVEFHAAGMVTFGLLGTSAEAEQKVGFDPDRAKRRKMYPEVCKIFKDYSVFIGGSTSFDFAGLENNKYDCVMRYARENGYTRDEIIYIGDDFGDGGGDSHVRIKGMDYIYVRDYRNFPKYIECLLKE